MKTENLANTKFSYLKYSVNIRVLEDHKSKKIQKIKNDIMNYWCESTFNFDVAIFLLLHLVSSTSFMLASYWPMQLWKVSLQKTWQEFRKSERLMFWPIFEAR